MSSRYQALTPGGDQYPNLEAASAVLPPPPPPPSSSHPLSRLRRDHAPQPPVLTTSVSGLSHSEVEFNTSGGYTVPNSTTSLTSPLSESGGLPYTSSNVGGPGGVASRMATRLSSGYTAPYNPGEWSHTAETSPRGIAGHAARAAQQARFAAQSRSQEVEALPPPPYSPRPLDTTTRSASNSTYSPGDVASSGVNTPRYNTPISAATTVSPNVSSYTRFGRPRPVSMYNPSEANNDAQQPSYYPPPPGPNTRSSRSTTRAPAEMVLNAFGLSSRSSRAAPAMNLAQGINIDTLQRETADWPHRAQEDSLSGTETRPPAAQRAASTGAILTVDSASRRGSRSGSQSPPRHGNREQGMPLPGPPPGPPPSSSRSQSLGGLVDPGTKSMLAPAPRPRSRPAPGLGTSLGPVPPTPADWVEGQSNLSFPKEGTSLHINTTNLSSSVGLFRSSAKRNPLVQGIRERRSASRNATERLEELSAVSISSNPWAEAMLADFKDNPRPADLNIADSDPGSSKQQRTPRQVVSARSVTTEENLSSAASITPRSPLAEGHSHTSSRPSSRQLKLSLNVLTDTPPFSPDGASGWQTLGKNEMSTFPARALPTPPIQHSVPSVTSTVLSSNPLRGRPISHILHLPNDTSAIPSSLSPTRPPSAAQVHVQTDIDFFIQDSLKRHQRFLDKERSAETDVDRLRIFSDYILAESRLRRRKYSKAWISGGFDVRQVRERLFEQNMHTPRRSSSRRENTLASPIEPTSAGGLADARNQMDLVWDNYQPCLSPIVSMSNNDEMSSRGRTSSRWWESQAGSGSGGMDTRLERSKRESKFMGFPRELREAMQSEASRAVVTTNTIGASHIPACTSEEKSHPETFGFYDDREPQSTNLPSISSGLESMPSRKLDVSRLVTLPPPYPRHYPALSNNHPDLTSFRTVVRTVSDFEEVKAREQRYLTSVEALQAESQRKLADTRQTFKSNIQAQIAEGSITFTEAAEAEQALELEEHELQQRRVQAEFDSFQDVVLNPLHETLNERISQIKSSMNELRNKLSTDAQAPNPNQTQEEGDEQPELLETLTQYKWLFEAGERIHQEIFRLLSERNDKYKSIVTLPYQQSKNKEKVRDTEVFFAKDDQDRQLAYRSEVLARHRDYLAVIEENVLRGVEVHLSAFWDIAPGLAAVLQTIPEDLENISGIDIPEDELQENPAYHQFPLQYLYCLLSHAERSSYQFIEAQINLLCLLHEVKTGVMRADCKVTEVQILKNAERDGERETKRMSADFAAVRRHEESVLTTDLKDKVLTVEAQWTEALGSPLTNVKRRVKGCLTEQNGWDETIDETTG